MSISFNSVLRILLVCCVFLGASWGLSLLKFTSHSDIHPLRGTLRAGWIDFYPFQSAIHDRGYTRREGLGFKVVETCFDRAGYRLDFRDITWSEQLNELDEGKIDLMFMAFRSPDREKIAYFSKPYFQQNYGIFYGKGYPLPPESADELLQYTRKYMMTISVTKGFSYPQELEPIIVDARNAHRLVEVATDSDNLLNIHKGQAQLTFMDETAGFAVVRDRHWEEAIAYQDIDCALVNIHVMFSKKTMKPEVVEAFNESLADIRANGTYSRLLRNIYYPRLLGIVMQNQVFRMINISAALFAGLTGVLLAHRERYDLVGAFALAGCPAVGGGIIRDLVAGRNPLGVVLDPINLISVSLLVTAGFLFFRFAPQKMRESVEAMNPATDPRLLIFDTLGMGAYTVTGVMIAMQCNCEPLWLWGPLLAVVQNGGGGILRDLLMGRGGSLAILKGTIYGEIAFLWGSLLSWFFIRYSEQSNFEQSEMIAAILLTIAGVVLTRVIILRRGWTSPLL